MIVALIIRTIVPIITEFGLLLQGRAGEERARAFQADSQPADLLHPLWSGGSLHHRHGGCCTGLPPHLCPSHTSALLKLNWSPSLSPCHHHRFGHRSLYLLLCVQQHNHGTDSSQQAAGISCADRSQSRCFNMVCYRLAARF